MRQVESKRILKPTIFIVMMIAFAMFFGNAQASFAAENGKPRLIAHGGGTVEGYGTTNSLEAVRQSIAEGYRLIELDMDFSQDGKIIMLHDWSRTAMHYFGNSFERRLDEREFERILIHGKFHTLTFKKLKSILDEEPDIRIVTDVKGDNVKMLAQIAAEDPHYVNRMIPQIYAYDQYDAVKALGYEDIILTLYAMPEVKYDELLQFVRQKDLYAVTVGDGHEYSIKDLKYKLAGDGVVVYYHPIYDYETAVEVMAGGVYGVYASNLIPREFEEPWKSYYLLDGNAKLLDIKTADKSVKSIKAIKIKNGAGKLVRYEIDGEVMTDEIIEGLEPGKHRLSVFITSGGKTAEMTYILWAHDDRFQILDEKYDYRTKEVKDPPEQGQVFRDAEVSDEIQQVLAHCLIAKSGEYYAYNNGVPMEFQVNGEFLHAQNYYDGSVLAPLAECVKAMGAESVTMDGSRYVYVYYDGMRTLMQANTFYLSQGYKGKMLKAPLILYRNKTMASGEVFGIITGREYIDDGSILIILPQGKLASKSDRAGLLAAASLLYCQAAGGAQPGGLTE